KSVGCLSPCRGLRRPDSQGRKARRPAGRTRDQIRSGHQPRHRKGIGRRNSAQAARACRRGDRMSTRREFITLLGGAAAAWPLAARAQEGERMRRIGVLMNLAADDPEGQVRIDAFLQGLQQFGWTVGRNLQVDTHWAAADADLFRRYATELVRAAPDVILAS